MKHWLVKTEPESYSIHHLKAEAVTAWDGVRNALAQQYLRQMEIGQLVLIYHSGREKAVVGLAEVTREKYLDATDESGKAVCVDLKYCETFERAVALAAIKASPKLHDIALVRISRLSVMPVGKGHWKAIMALAGRPE